MRKIVTIFPKFCHIRATLCTLCVHCIAYTVQFSMHAYILAVPFCVCMYFTFKTYLYYKVTWCPATTKLCIFRAEPHHTGHLSPTTPPSPHHIAPPLTPAASAPTITDIMETYAPHCINMDPRIYGQGPHTR